jgi:hypothetical protein
MRFDALTIVLEPIDFQPGGLYEPPGVRYEEFASELARYASVSVAIIEAPLDSAPPTGMLLVYGGSGLRRWFAEGGLSEQQRCVLARTILLDADRSEVLEMVEEFSFAGAIEKYRYFQWLSQRDEESGHQLFGLKSVAKSMGAICSEVFASERYCSLDDSRFSDLPSLVVGYLREYTKMLPDPVK